MFSQLCQQIMPNFVVQRSLYEVRERPSKTYSWKIFVLSNIAVEIPWSRKSTRASFQSGADQQYSLEQCSSSAGTIPSAITGTRAGPMPSHRGVLLCGVSVFASYKQTL
jgi:ATP-binding cassette subfamily G (WHITE) protein 2 (PDR)